MVAASRYLIVPDGKLLARLIESCVQLKPSVAMSGCVVCEKASAVLGGGSPPAGSRTRLPRPAAYASAMADATLALDQRGTLAAPGAPGVAAGGRLGIGGVDS